MLRPRRLLTLIALGLATVGLAACGNHPNPEGARIVHAETEGIYLDINDLKYQVQISRQLNPDDPEDRAFLVGIPDDESNLKSDETWFGVFLRVQNTTHEALLPSSEIEIHDTQDTVYEPIALEDFNVFAYDSTEPIEGGALLPEQDTAAAETPIQGALLLFKMTNESLDNRPLELIIEGRRVPRQTGIIDLDV